MKKFVILGLLAALGTGVAAPAHAGDKEGFGLILGALGGGVAGHQFGQGKGNTWATAIGAVAGAVAGQSIGQSLDRADYGYNNRSAYYAPRGWNQGWEQNTYYRAEPVPVYYVSPSYERRVRTYEVRPAPTYIVDNSVGYARSDRYCREYQSAVTVGGRRQGSYGTACLQPDGDWEITQ